MQANGALQGGSTIPRRGRLQVLLAILAIVVIAALVGLLVWTALLASSGGGAQDAKPKAGAGSVIIHDDPWNLPHNAGSAPIHDDPWKLKAN